ncbi:unnamed protein product [Polarella glacialis]|uniref:Uncharacterized protein n=1 Tax=Polarella glacialis TaxID=89957 RepID=A0A813GE97_POLGL|nr:unnamed protein product [Polarella glacialis]
MEDPTWTRLRLPDEMKRALLVDYKCTLRFQAAYDSLPEAMAIARNYVSAAATEEEIEEFGEELFDWAVHNQSSFKRLRITAVKFRTEEGHRWDEGTVNASGLAADLFEEMGNSTTLAATVIRTHRKSSLSNKLCQEGANKEEVEEAERIRWAGILAGYIQDACLPVCEMVRQTAWPAVTWTKVFGDRRALTLRNRARTWKTVVEWLFIVFGVCHPQAEFQLIDYLNVRGEEPCGKSVPQAIAAALSVIEDVGRVSEADKISGSASWIAVVDAWTAKLAVGNTTKKRAELYPVAVMISLELMVVGAAPDFLRAWAWVMLLKIWMCLRTDDLQGLDHTRMVLSTSQLRCVLTRTKTTGPGKRTLEVATFVSRKATLSGADWVSVGYELWNRDPFNFQRGYFVAKSTKDYSGCIRSPATNALMVAYDRVVLAHSKWCSKTAPNTGYKERPNSCRRHWSACGQAIAAGLVGRLSGRLLGRSYCWQSIFADDLVILAGGKDKWISILVTIAVWLMVGTPLAWHKFRGGLATDWVGFYLDMQTFSVGISLARAQWLTRWAAQVHQDGMADMRRFAEALGRLGFATHVLLWAKPFLAPLYAWSAAAPAEATIRVPKMIRLTLLFLEEQLTEGRHMLPCRKLWKDHGEWFRTDAKCDPDKVVLGGWICKDETPTSKASWFSLTLTPVQVPWLFKADKGSSWASTSAELLATIVAVQAFDISCETGGTAVTRISAGTDNQANDKLSRKMSSTKMPLGLLLMQLATTLSARRLQLHLDWRPREENQEADDLTNNRYDAFDETKRVNISWNQVEKGLLEKLLLCQSEEDCAISRRELPQQPTERVETKDARRNGPERKENLKKGVIRLLRHSAVLLLCMFASFSRVVF